MSVGACARSIRQESCRAPYTLALTTTHSRSQRLTATRSGMASLPAHPVGLRTTPAWRETRPSATSSSPGIMPGASPMSVAGVCAPVVGNPRFRLPRPGSARTGVNEGGRLTGCPCGRRRPRPRGQERRHQRRVTSSGQAFGGGQVESRSADRCRARGHDIEVSTACPPCPARCPRRRACHRYPSLTTCPAESLSSPGTTQSRACRRPELALASTTEVRPAAAMAKPA